MRPSSEQEAVDFLQRCGFKIDGEKIIPNRPENELSEVQTDNIAFLCKEHGYGLADCPQPKKQGLKFFDDSQALIYLGQMGFTFDKGVITAPKGYEPKPGPIAEAIAYLCNEWGWTMRKAVEAGTI